MESIDFYPHPPSKKGRPALDAYLADPRRHGRASAAKAAEGMFETVINEGRKRKRLSIERRPPQEFDAGATMMRRELYEL
jgi:hypothetical protein